MPRWGRRIRPSGGVSSSRAAQHERHRVAEEHQLAAGAQQPGRLGQPEVRVGPDGGAVLRDDQVEATRSRSGTASPAAWTRGNGRSNSAWKARAVASWPSVGSMPTTDAAPRRASQADT